MSKQDVKTLEETLAALEAECERLAAEDRQLVADRKAKMDMLEAAKAPERDARRQRMAVREAACPLRRLPGRQFPLKGNQS